MPPQISGFGEICCSSLNSLLFSVVGLLVDSVRDFKDAKKRVVLVQMETQSVLHGVDMTGRVFKCFRIFKWSGTYFPNKGRHDLKNKAKPAFANKLFSDSIAASAGVYCYFLSAELNGYYHHQNRKAAALFC